MGEIVITEVTAAGTEVRAEVQYTRDVRRFFGDETFFVEYDVDVSDVPERVLTIPVLAHVCPVAWATESDVTVSTVDERYLQTLRTARATLCEMYPALMDGGEVIVENGPSGSAPVTEPGDAVGESPRTDDSTVATLFTGGVDSLATYIRHREENPTFINIQGWVIGIDDDEQWKQTKHVVEDYAGQFDVSSQFVRSNMLSFLDWRMLVAHFNRHHDGGWYSAVACGLGLTGLCAPLAVVNGYQRLYMAGTVWDAVTVPEVVDHWDGSGMPWGSHPDIVNNVRWADSEVVHDGFDLSRQERVRVIADFVRETGRDDLLVRSCTDSEQATNCTECEKCFRTAFGLALEGMDPNNHGFDLGPDDFDRAREGLESGEWIHNEPHKNYWQDMRRHDPPDRFPVDGGQAFFEWLQTVDFDAVARSSKPPLQDRTVRTVIRNMPYPVYDTFDSLYSSFSGRAR